MKSAVKNHLRNLKNKNVEINSEDHQKELAMSGYFVLYSYNNFVRETKHFFRNYGNQSEHKYIKSNYTSWIEEHADKVEKSLQILKYILCFENSLKSALVEVVIIEEIIKEDYFINYLAKNDSIKERFKTIGGEYGFGKDGCDIKTYITEYSYDCVHSLMFNDLIKLLSVIYTENIKVAEKIVNVVFGHPDRVKEKEMISKWEGLAKGKLIGELNSEMDTQFSSILWNESLIDTLYVGDFTKKHNRLIEDCLLNTIVNYKMDDIHFEDRYIYEYHKFLSNSSEKPLLVTKTRLDKFSRKAEFRAIIKELIDMNSEFIETKKMIKRNIRFKECYAMMRDYLREYIIRDELVSGGCKRAKVLIAILTAEQVEFGISEREKNGMDIVCYKYKNLEIYSYILFFDTLREYRNSISHGKTFVSYYVRKYNYKLKKQLLLLFEKHKLISKEDYKICNNAYKYYHKRNS